MDKEDFLDKCDKVGVDKILSIDNEYDDGFIVLLKDGNSVYVIYRHEFGDSWVEYESEKHFIERWKNMKILTPEEEEEYRKRTLETMKDKYSDKNFSGLLNLLLPNVKP